MCGICGIIDKRGNPVTEQEINVMTDLVRHRGPDARGTYQSGHLSLGHRRLSILDLSENGRQPMHRDECVIVYNGEIYNFIELRSELSRMGYNLKSGTDTEVILAAYDHWGQACVQRFNGMWAFALYDSRKQILFCSRDRFGVKPFYYRETDSRFFFGSEIKQLLHFMPTRHAQMGKLVDYLALGLEEYDTETFFQDIHNLAGGHNLIYDLSNRTFFIAPYYQLTVKPELTELTLDQAIERYRAELDRSVTFRLRSDVRVGACLSGGLDSSSVASIAAGAFQRQTGRRFCAITAKSMDPRSDETRYAEKVAQKSDMEWHVISPSVKDFQSVLDSVVQIQEEPFGSPSIIMQYYVMQKARELNCPVLLDGQGGDETLLGYERYYPAYLLSLKWHDSFSAFLHSAKNSKLTNLRLLLYFLYFPNARLRLNRFLRNNRIMHNHALKLVNRDFAFKLASSYRNIVQLQELELRQTQLPHLLKYEDRNSMYHSIETRLPFVDYQLIETSLSLQNGFKIREGWTKYILRRAMQERLPDEIVWRKNKIGFEAPMRLWMQDLTLFKEDLSASKILPALVKPVYLRRLAEIKDLRLLWKLVNIAKWEKLFNVEI
jgi:asparagine synthase (glutamine-hydrolysing)